MPRKAKRHNVKFVSLLRASASIGALTLVSRLLGFVRDMMIAAMLGAGMLSDAFLVAFKLPNFMRQLFAEGAFNAAFVPLYAGTLAENGAKEAQRFAEEAHSALLIVLLIVVGLGVYFMPELMVVLAPGFDRDPEKFRLTVLLTRITFPYILFISLVSLQGGILNSVDKFAAVAATPIIMNICLIGAMLMVAPFTPTAAHALAIGVMFSGVAQYVWLFYICRRVGVGLRFVRPRFTTNVKNLLTLIWPAALGSSVTQINLVVNIIIASLIPGAVSVLYYAVRLEELPFGVIGIAVSTALLPMLSRQIREGNTATALHTQNRALELSLLFGLPATVALMVIPYPIVTVIYEHGAFRASDTLATYKTLIAFSAGLPAGLAVKIFASTFYANRDTRTPVKIAMLCVAINLGLNLALMGSMQYIGLALSSSIASWVNAILLIRYLHKRTLFKPDALLLMRLPRLLICSLIMGAALRVLYGLLTPYFHAVLFIRILALGLLIIIGMGSYALTILSLNVFNLGQLKIYFSRRSRV